MNLLKKLIPPIKSAQNFLEKLTKKQILILGGLIPMGFLIGIALRTGFNKISGRNFEKYNIEKFSIIDTLRADIIIRKKGEIYTDTLIDYYKLSKKEIKFKESVLFVKNKEFSKYKLLKSGIPSEEIFGKNSETKNYSLTQNLFSGGFKLNKLELIKYGKDSNFLDDSLNVNADNKQDTSYGIYTRETDLGKKVLDSEQAEVKAYLNKIAEYKKSLKD